MQLGAIVSAVTGCKKTIDTLRAWDRVPQQCEHLLRVSAALQTPLRTVTRLQSRHATSAFVHDAAAAAVRAVAQLDEIFGQIPDDLLQVGADESMWERWWSAVPAVAGNKMSNATRLSQLAEHQVRLSHVIGLLQLALTTVALEVADPETRRGTQPFTFQQLALDDGRAVFHLFEMGRLPPSPTAAGVTGLPRYPLCAGVLRKRSTSTGTGWRDVGLCSVILQPLQADRKTGYELAFFSAGDAGSDGLVSTAVARLTLTEGLVSDQADTRFSRELLRGPSRDGDPLVSAVRYRFGAEFQMDFLALPDPWLACPEYPAAGNERYVRVTAEVFELVVMLAANMARSRDSRAVDALMGDGKDKSIKAHSESYRVAVESWLPTMAA